MRGLRQSSESAAKARFTVDELPRKSPPSRWSLPLLSCPSVATPSCEGQPGNFSTGCGGTSQPVKAPCANVIRFIPPSLIMQP
eukprot:7139075-Prymnesium_polylepis.1